MVSYIQDVFLNKRDIENKLVIAAPRGHAKSTIFTFLAIMWAVCYNYKKVIVVVSATNPIAKKFITGCRVELETNDLLLKDFGKFEGNVIWSASEFCTKNDVYVCGKGAGEQMRGLRWKESRPDCVLIDDLESKENVATDLQRANLEDWFTGDLLPMGAPGCDYLYVGTILSYEALLYKLLHEPRFSSWQRRLYSAVIKEPDNEDLWVQWEKIFTDPKRGDRAYDDAYEFYLKNKKRMLKGVELLWEKQRPNMYLFLRTKKVENEEKYNSEYQNDPMTESTRMFKQEWLDKCIYQELPEITELYFSVDYAGTATKKSDGSAIICVGKGVDNRYYVMEADIRKRKPEDVIDDIIMHLMKYYGKYKIAGFAVETDVFLNFLAEYTKEKLLSVGFHIDWVELKQSQRGSKELRIESLIPKIRNGYLMFHPTQIQLLSQLKNYPKGKRDGIDALEMAVSIISKQMANTFAFTSLSTASPRASLYNFMGNRR